MSSAWKMLEQWLAAGVIVPVDYEFARVLADIEAVACDELLICAALTSQWLQRGHVCLDLGAFAPEDLQGADPGATATLVLPAPEVLDRFKSVGRPGDFAPLTRVGARLYLTRYWAYEQRIVQAVTARVSRHDAELVFDAKARFGDSISASQAEAVRSALAHRFCIITGGPGTGKTSTVAKLLCALLEKDRAATFAVCAPTGKAAARLDESLGAQVASLDCRDEIRERLLDPGNRASTLHRLLGSRPNSPFFRHHHDNPLPYDLVVVDEASMVDVALMAKLVDALRGETRLVLVGDKDQLSSVEAGSVLGDLCAGAGEAEGLEGGAERLGKAITVLRENFRAKDAPGIVAFSQLFARKDAPALDDLRAFRESPTETLAGDVPRDVCWRIPSGNALEWETEFAAVVRAAWSGLASATSGKEAFQIFRQLQILAAVRGGPRGVEQLNVLAQTALGHGRHAAWFQGRPVMITHNDYTLDLFNGDIGIAFREAARYFVWFERASGELRQIAANRLPPHESAYAITIHKSQGTEAERVLMILPDHDSPVATRELVYTGATRARRRLDLWAGEAVLQAAAGRRTLRVSGLAAQLWGDHAN